jgi:hypothetical protein
MPTMPYSGDHPVFNGGIDYFLLRVESEDGCEGSEGFLSHAQNGRVGICHNGRGKETFADSVSALSDRIPHMLPRLVRR